MGRTAELWLCCLRFTYQPIMPLQKILLCLLQTLLRKLKTLLRQLKILLHQLNQKQTRHC